MAVLLQRPRDDALTLEGHVHGQRAQLGDLLAVVAEVEHLLLLLNLVVLLTGELVLHQVEDKVEEGVGEVDAAEVATGLLFQKCLKGFLIILKLYLR